MNASLKMFHELESILIKECELHEELLRAAAQVNEAIKESDLTRLQQQTCLLDQQIMHVEKSEEERNECCASISRELGIQNGLSVKLGTLIEKAPHEQSGSLYKLHAQLKAIVEKVAYVNVSNRVLLQEGLQLIKGKFTMFMQSGAHTGQYRYRGDRAVTRPLFGAIFNKTA